MNESHLPGKYKHGYRQRETKVVCTNHFTKCPCRQTFFYILLEQGVRQICCLFPSVHPKDVSWKAQLYWPTFWRKCVGSRTGWAFRKKEVRWKPKDLVRFHWSNTCPGARNALWNLQEIWLQNIEDTVYLTCMSLDLYYIHVWRIERYICLRSEERAVFSGFVTRRSPPPDNSILFLKTVFSSSPWAALRHGLASREGA